MRGPGFGEPQALVQHRVGGCLSGRVALGARACMGCMRMPVASAANQLGHERLPLPVVTLTPTTPISHAQVATEHLCGSCKQCGGGLTNTIRPDVARKRLVVFRNLAAYHKFDLLQQLADDALGRV